VRLRDWVRELLDGPAHTEWQMAPGELDNVFSQKKTPLALAPLPPVYP